MKLPYRITQAASQISRAGISYHAHGVTKMGRAALFDFFQTDKVTDAQIAKLKEFCPDIQVSGVRMKSAPEIQQVHLLFPKAAWYRMKNTAAIAPA
jgi:hypothetical protein